MNKEIIDQLILSLSGVFTDAQLTRLEVELNHYVPGSFRSIFEKQFLYTTGSLFSPLIHEYEPSTCILADGIGVSETFAWEGVELTNTLAQNPIALPFEVPFTFTFQNMIDLESPHVYPREYKLASQQDILKAVLTLSIAHLNLSPVLYFFVLNKLSLKEKFQPVYQAIGPRPIHEGVLKKIATEPGNHTQFNSRNLPSSEINRRSMQMYTDITRSYDFMITAEEKTWRIRADELSDKKVETFDLAFKSLQEMQCLPVCVLDILRLGTHQSGYLNEATLAVGPYISEISHHKITLLQSGIQRSLQFTVKNRQIEVHDQCEWHEVAAPSNSPGAHDLDCINVTLSKYKPLSLCYRYTLAADAKNKLSHQIKEISLTNEDQVRALIPK